MPVQVAWAEFQAPQGASLSATQTVPSPAQVATVDRTVKSVQVAWSEFRVWDVTASVLAISASQTVPEPTQVATMFDVVGTISGGGTITETLPWRVVSTSQLVPAMGQSARLNDAPAVALLSANQSVPTITQSAAMDASRTIAAAQLVPEIVQSARLNEPVGVGGYSQDGGGKGRKPRILEGPRPRSTQTSIVDRREEFMRLAAQSRIAAQQAAQTNTEPAQKAKQTAQESAVAQMQAERKQREALQRQLQVLTRKVDAMQTEHTQQMVKAAAVMQAQMNQAATVAAQAMSAAQAAKDDAEALAALI